MYERHDELGTPWCTSYDSWPACFLGALGLRLNLLTEMREAIKAQTFSDAPVKHSAAQLTCGGVRGGYEHPKPQVDSSPFEVSMHQDFSQNRSKNFNDHWDRWAFASALIVVLGSSV